MQKGKYIIKIFLTCLIATMLVSGFTRNEAYAETKGKISDIISLTGIMSDSIGNQIISGKHATREEFAQMLIQASPYAGEVQNTNKLKLFKDVAKNNKKAAYIQIAVSKGYMSGYLEGKFKPTKVITLKEAIYGTLGVLGYSKEDFTGNLSNGRYEKFKELGLSKNLSCGETDGLTKSDCVTLFYNLLNAKLKSGEIYGKATFGYSYNEEGEIDYQSLLNKKVKGPYVTKSGWDDTLNSALSSYRIERGNETITAAQIESNSIFYYSEQAKRIWIYNEKVYGSLDNITYNQGEPQEVTISGTTYTVEKPATMKQSMKTSGISKGTLVVLLLGRDDKVSEILKLSSLVAEGNWKQELSFDINLGTIYKNGVRITADAIDNRDVIYYSKDLKTLWVYGKKVYGVLETVSPASSAPEAITIAGKTYELKAYPINTASEATGKAEYLVENAWGERLRENGISEGDNVAVLFGYGGAVVDICAVDNMPITIAGYVIETENKVVKNASTQSNIKQVIRIVDTEGILREFPCSDSTIGKGMVVEVDFQNNQTVITKINTATYNTLTDIATKKLAEGARIIEVKDQNYTKITVAQLKEATWNASNILYYKLNSSNEITELIITNATDSIYQCGILKKVVYPGEEGIGSFQLTFDFGGKEVTIINDNPNGNMNPGPKAVIIENNQVKVMQDLQEATIAYISQKQANTGDAVYRIADDVIVYFYKNGEYYKGSLEDITNFGDYHVKGYKKQLQGPIRVIIVTN